MVEYIEREVTCKECVHYSVCYHIEHYGREIETDNPCEQFKPADVVEVVCCNGCKYNVANMEKDPLDATDYSGADIVCSYFMTDGMHPDDFCSYGEKAGDTD